MKFNLLTIGLLMVGSIAYLLQTTPCYIESLICTIGAIILLSIENLKRDLLK